MEDGMVAAESMVFPSDVNPEVGSHKSVEEDRGEANKEKGGVGFMSRLLSSIVSEEEAEKMDAVQKLDEVDEVKEESEKGGGSMIDNLISKLVKQEESSAANQENGNGEENDASKSVKNGVGNEGALSKLISNFLHPKEDEGKENVEVDSREANKNGDLVESKVEVKTNGKAGDSGEGGGIIEHIVSHLPQSFPDDAAPTTDEASILIHSLVHD